MNNSTKYVALLLTLTMLTVGCQQKMADQPAHRPYEESTVFEHKQSARPLEFGVVHRNQYLSDDPMITWLTELGKKPKADESWKQRVDPTGESAPPAGATNDVANFIDKFPFELTAADFDRGQVLYNANCALCHGGSGHGNGKIPERGYLKPPSYHTDPNGEAKDWSKLTLDETTKKMVPDYTGNPQGTSRGFYIYGKEVPLKEVPVGYIFQVITWGYGGMAAHDTQIPDPADRWRVVAYVRALQLSQAADATKLSSELQSELNKPKTKVDHKDGEKH